jgi:polysaccharide export outer membrane protein
MVNGIRFTGFFLFLLLILLAVSLTVGAEQVDYRLKPGDTLRFTLWTWGNEPLQQVETALRPDGKVALAFGMVQGETYRLGAGDLLSIDVWGCQDFTGYQMVVRPDGKLSVPLVGELMVAGLTPYELTQKLTLALSKYLKEPKVNLNVAKFRTVPLVREFDAQGLTLQELTAQITATLKATISEARLTIDILKFGATRVYVLGEVNKPGLCEIEKTHNVLDAIGAAGGFTKNADRKLVYLVRKGQTDQYTKINLDRLLKKGDLSQNYSLNDGDVVYFNRNKIDFVRDILPFITAIYQIKHFDD